MSSGLTHLSNSSSVKYPSFNAASFSVDPSLCAVLAIFAAFNQNNLLLNHNIFNINY